MKEHKVLEMSMEEAVKCLYELWINSECPDAIFTNNEIENMLKIESQEWFNLKTACSLKGIIYKTVCNRPYLKPQGGVEDGIIGGRKMWRQKTIQEWLEQDDKTLTRLYKTD